MFVDFEMFVAALVKTVKDKTGYKEVCVDDLQQYFLDSYDYDFEKAVVHAETLSAYYLGDF